MMGVERVEYNAHTEGENIFQVSLENVKLSGQ